MKDIRGASFVLDIKLYIDRSRGVLGLSQKVHIHHILKQFNMCNRSSEEALIIKGNKFS